MGGATGIGGDTGMGGAIGMGGATAMRQEEFAIPSRSISSSLFFFPSFFPLPLSYWFYFYSLLTPVRLCS